MSLATEYTDDVGIEHRRRFAQFFTPPAIAQFMVNWVLSNAKRNEIHDPAFGLGAFWKVAPRDCVFTGSDADDIILAYFKKRTPEAAVQLECVDYLLSFGKSFANIVCNPPYLRFQKFKNRNQVFNAVSERLGIRFSGYTNIASAFLVKSISELDENGRLAYILPSEFLNAGYGELVKDVLIRDRHLDSIIKIECEHDAFDEVTTSVCIVLYDKTMMHETVAFRKVTHISQLAGIMSENATNEIEVSALNPKSKWECFFSSGKDMIVPNMDLLQELGQYGRFSRGIATGANEFFVLSKSDIAELKISSEAYLPCITKSQQIKTAFFTDKDFATLANANAPVFLFAPGATPDTASAKYIQDGERRGYDKGFITRHRMPWYKTESRTVAPILLNVFSRGGYKVVRNFSSAQSLTNFHCFYPNPIGQQYVDWLFLYLHSDIGRKILSLSKRKYGGALDKFEPNDLNLSLVPKKSFFDSLGGDKLNEIVSALKCGEDLCEELRNLFRPLLLPPTEALRGMGHKESKQRMTQMCFDL